MQHKIALVILTLFLAVATAVSAAVPAAEAQPRFPSSFYGYVTLDGQPAPDGTTLEAFINGVRYMQTTTLTQQNGQAAYTINVPQDDPMTAAVEGGHQNDTITFVVAGRYTAAERGTFLIGQNTALNLSASSVLPTPTPTPRATATPQPTSSPTPSPTETISLYAGSNIIAYRGPSQDVGSALASIAGQFSIVYHYNNRAKSWESYDPSLPPFANSLRQLETGEAYWISVLRNIDLRLSSSTQVGATSLYAGWNLVTYFGPGKSLSDILIDLPTASAIYAFDNRSKGWNSYLSSLPPFANSLTSIPTGAAFWVYVSSDTVWAAR